MQRINSSDNLFHNGDGRTTLGTVVTAEWLNSIQEELVSLFIELGGDNLLPAKNNQLAELLKKKLESKASITDFTSLHDLFLGIPIPYPLSTVPTGCLAMNGQRFDKSRYPKLALKYPSGTLPDMRGEFIRGLDNGRGVDAGREVLSAQGEELKSHNHEFGIKSGDSFHPQKVEFTAKTDGISGAGYSSIYMNRSDNGGDKQPYANAHWVGIKPSGGKETRPRNIAFQYICLAA